MSGWLPEIYYGVIVGGVAALAALFDEYNAREWSRRNIDLKLSRQKWQEKHDRGQV